MGVFVLRIELCGTHWTVGGLGSDQTCGGAAGRFVPWRATSGCSMAIASPKQTKHPLTSKVGNEPEVFPEKAKAIEGHVYIFHILKMIRYVLRRYDPEGFERRSSSLEFFL